MSLCDSCGSRLPNQVCARVRAAATREAPRGSAHHKDSACQGINIKRRFKCRDYHPNHLGVTEHQKAEERRINATLLTRRQISSVIYTLVLFFIDVRYCKWADECLPQRPEAAKH